MSRRRGRLLAGVSRWLNLAPGERIATRLADIRSAVADVRRILENAPELRRTVFHRVYVEAVLGCVEELTPKLIERLPAPQHADERDPELGEVLDEIDRRLGVRDRMAGISRDVALTALETFAAPYALAFYYEIRRLERITTCEVVPSHDILTERNL